MLAERLFRGGIDSSEISRDVVPDRWSALVASGMLASTLLVGSVVDAAPTEAAVSQIVIGMPFEGRWAYSNATSTGCGSGSGQTSHPSCHEIYFGDWSTDLYAAAGTEVKLKADSDKALSFTWDTTASGSCGETRRINVFADNVKIGRVHFTHLTSAASTDTAPTNNMTIGKVANLSCNPGGSDKHIHVEFDNEGNTSACYTNHSNETYTAGMVLGEGSVLGILGSGNQGSKEACNGDSTPTAAPPRPTSTNTTGWMYENLEGDAGSAIPHVANTGKDPAAIEFNGQLYVFSYDEENGNLRMNSTRPYWGSTVLDGDPASASGRNVNTGKNPAAVIYAHALHVFYYDQTEGDLRHAWSANGVNWQTEPLDGHAIGNGRSAANVGGTPAAAVWGDSLQVFYRDIDNTNLKHAWTTPLQGWRFETLDGDPNSVSGRDGNVGLDPSAVIWNDTLALFYRDEGSQRLRHAYTTATQGWQFVQLDGDPGSMCHSSYMNTGSNPSAIVHEGQIHVFSYDSTGGNLRHARFSADAGGWRCETLDGDPGSAIGNNTNVGAMPTAASVGGTLQLFAYQPEHGGLHHYWSGANGWQNENFDGFGGSPSGRVNQPTGLEPVVANYQGVPHVFYYDHTSGNLRHARPN